MHLPNCGLPGGVVPGTGLQADPAGVAPPARRLAAKQMNRDSGPFSNGIALMLASLLLPAGSHAQFMYASDGSEVTIWGYAGPGGEVVIPDTIEGLPVVAVGDSAFEANQDVTRVTIPTGIVSIGGGAFRSCGNLVSITIPDTVTSIGAQAFHYCGSLDAITVDPANPAYRSQDGVLFDRDMTLLIQFPGGKAGDYVIPTGLTGIGAYAFSGCTRLASVTIPETMDSIGDRAFYYCESLAGVTVPESVTSIGDQAFYYCHNLASIVVPDSVETIGASAFASCRSLTHATIGSSVTSIGAQVFASCTGLTNITLGESVGSIGDSVFSGCTNLSAIVLPDSVTSIPDGAFGGCSALRSVTFGDNVEGIGRSTFSGCSSLASIAIPAALTSLGAFVFDGCTSLEEFVVDPLNPEFASLDGVLFNRSATHLIRFPGGRTGSYSIPDSVTSVDDRSFADCIHLTSVGIPGKAGFVGNHSFQGCRSLTEIVVDPTNHAYQSVDGVLFSGDATVLLAFPGGRTGEYTIPDGVTKIWGEAFRSCGNLAGVTIPDSVSSIGGLAFYSCSGLTSVTIPEGVTEIGDEAFRSCPALASVSIGNGASTIGRWAFMDCGSLRSIEVDAANTAYRSIDGVLFNRDGSVLVQFPGGRDGDYVLPDSVAAVGDYAFAYSRGLSNVAIPDSVTSIGTGAFRYCDTLAGVSIGDGVTGLGGGAFGFCPKLKAVRIGKSVGSVGGSAFTLCSGLRTIVIPASVTSLGSTPFSACSSLTAVFFEGDAPKTLSSAFGGTTGAVVYRLPGTAGWDKLFSYRTPRLWLPQVMADDAGFGMGESGFGFDVFWAEGREVVVESSDNLANGAWSTAGTVTVENGSAHFTDAEAADHPHRFYRLFGP